jgi:hypothetical protein
MTAAAYAIDPDTLDFDALVADYNDGLVARLRGFGPAAAGLALWVPDEDPHVCLRNLWDAAASSGMPSLTVEIGAGTASRLDVDRVLRTAARFGVATSRPTRDGLWLEVTALRPAAPLLPIASHDAAVPRSAASAPARTREVLPEVYRAAIGHAAAVAVHDAPVIAESPLVLVEGVDADVTLSLAVDPVSTCIVIAGFAGAGDRDEIGMLEALCLVIEGLPVLEAADHGVLRLERALRRGDAPVPGIVTPRAVASAFDRPHALLRAALAHARAVMEVPGITSTYDPGPSPHWRHLDRRGREAVVATVVDAFTRAQALPEATFSLVAIEHDVRLVFRAEATPSLPALVMALERSIRTAIDPRLEVYLEEIRDRNKLRRLAVVEG